MPGSIDEMNALSLDDLKQLIQSERERLLDENTLNASPTLLAAFAIQYSKSILDLDAKLGVAGRSGTIEPRVSQLQCESERLFFSNNIEHHQYTVRQMTYLVEFIIAEEKYLVENKARAISSNYFEAWAKLQPLQIDEVKIYLLMTPKERIATLQSAPLCKKSVPFEAAHIATCSTRSRAASTTALCPPSIIPLFMPRQKEPGIGRKSVPIPSGDSPRSPMARVENPTASTTRLRERELDKIRFLSAKSSLEIHIKNKFSVIEPDEDELMFKIDDL